MVVLCAACRTQPLEPRNITGDGGAPVNPTVDLARADLVRIVDLAFVIPDQSLYFPLAPFDLKLRAEDAYWITYPRELARKPNVQAFRDWLLREAHSEPEAVPTR